MMRYMRTNQYSHCAKLLLQFLNFLRFRATRSSHSTPASPVHPKFLPHPNSLGHPGCFPKTKAAQEQRSLISTGATAVPPPRSDLSPPVRGFWAQVLWSFASFQWSTAVRCAASASSTPPNSARFGPWRLRPPKRNTSA